MRVPATCSIQYVSLCKTLRCFILLCLKLLAYRCFRTINTIREEDKETFRRL